MADLYDGKITVDLDIHVEADWHRCHAEAVLDRGERDDIQAAGAAGVRYSAEHDRYLVTASWSDFWFYPTWDTAFARFLQEVADRTRALGHGYHDRSRVAVTEAGAPVTRRPG